MSSETDIAAFFEKAGVPHPVMMVVPAQEEEATGCGITFSKLTDSDGLLSKSAYLDDTGQPVIDSSGCSMVRGQAERVTLPGLSDLPALLDTLPVSQALTLGVTDADRAQVVTRNALNGSSGIVARTKQFFNWPDGDILAMLDHDPSQYGTQVRDAEHLIGILSEVDPQWAGVEYVVTASTTAALALDGHIFKQGSGFHLYVRVAGSGDDLKRYFETLGKALWQAGHGHIQISRAGSLLTRTLIDLAVFSPERLIFEGGIDKRSPRITQNRPVARYVTQQGKAITPNLTWRPQNEVDHRKRVAEAKGALKGQQVKAKAAWRGQREKEMLTNGLNRTQARKVFESQDRGVLLPPYQLLMDGWIGNDGTPTGRTWLTVGQILSSPAAFEGLTLADPLRDTDEPNKAVVILEHGKTKIISLAHGGQVFELLHNFASLTALLDGMDEDTCRQEWATLAASTDLSASEEDNLAELLKEKLKITKKSFESDLKEARSLLSDPEPNTQHEVAEDFVETQLRGQYPQGVISSGGSLYIVINGIWEQVDHGPFRQIVGEEYVGKLCERVSDYRQIVKHAMEIVDQGPTFFSESSIPVGIYTPAGFYSITPKGDIRIETNDPLQHRARFMTAAAPAVMPTPYLDAWLSSSVVGPDALPQRNLIQELVGASLFGLLAKLQLVALLYGAGDSGKSMLLRLLELLFPKFLTTSVPPADWDNEQHRAKLIGARLNVAGDLPSNNLLEGSWFKRITGEDSYSAKEVYREVTVGHRNTAAHWFSCNTGEYPPLTAADDAFFARWQVVHFPVTIPKGQRILDLEKRIAIDECAGLLQWAMAGAQRVVRQGFTQTATRELIIEDWRIASNSVSAFLADADEGVLLTNQLSDFVRRSDLYQHYLKWCRQAHRKPFSKSHTLAQFNRLLSPAFGEDGSPGYRGLRIIHYFGY